MPIVFLGDLFNTHQILDVTEKPTIKQLKQYLANFLYFRGFTDQNIMMSRNLDEDNEMIMKLNSKLIKNNPVLEAKLNNKDFSMNLFYEFKHVFPIFQLDQLKQDLLKKPEISDASMLSTYLEVIKQLCV